MVDDEGNASKRLLFGGYAARIISENQTHPYGANHVPGLTIIGLKDFCHFLSGSAITKTD